MRPHCLPVVRVAVSDRPALMDFQVKNGRVSALTVNGVNALTRKTVVYADGSTGTATGFSTEAIVAGVVVGGFIIYKAVEDDSHSGTGIGSVGTF